MKKILIIFNLLIATMLAGCQTPSNNTSIVWYVDNGTFGYLETNLLYKPVENEKTIAISKLLKENNINHEVIFKCYDSELDNGYYGFIDRLKEKDASFDIVTFNPLDYEKFMNLDKQLKKKTYKDLSNIIPEKAWQAHKINGGIYQIPKPMPYLLQPSISIAKDYMLKHNISVDFVKRDPVNAVQYLMHIAKEDPLLNKEYNLIGSGSIYLESFNQDTYRSITDLYEHFFDGILIRKSDHKVVNIYEEEQLKIFTNLNNQIYKDNLDGHIEQIDLPISLKIGYTFPSEYEEDSDFNVIPISTPHASSSIGYGILKDSKHQKKALQILQFLYTNKTASNIFIYGIEGKDYSLQNKRAITKKRNDNMMAFGTFSNLGNNLIAYPSEVEPLNKQALARKYNEQLSINTIHNFIPNIDTIQREFAEINKIYRNASLLLNTSEIPDLNVFYHNVNEQLYAAGLQKVIDELQLQVDTYRKESK